MRSITAVLLAAAFAVSAAPAANAQMMAHGPTTMRIPPLEVHLAADTVTMPMETRDGRVVVPVTISGKGPFPFIFDTGAHGSVMDLAFARQLGLKLGAEIMVGSPGGAGKPGHLVALENVGMGGVSIGALPCVAFEGMPFKGDDPPRGVIGPYGFSGLLITLDYPHQRLVFTRGALPDADQREIFGWTADQPLPRVPITVAGQKIDVHLDSGAKHGLSLATSYEKTLPLAGPPVAAGRARTVDQDVAAERATLKGTVTIGRYTLEHPTLFFSDLHQEVGNVGPVLLRQFSLTLDPANRRLRLSGPANGKLADLEPPATP